MPETSPSSAGTPADGDQPHMLSAADEIPGRRPKPPPRPSRSWLRMSARWWRALEWIGMTIHHSTPPWPPAPSFTRRVKSTLAAGYDGEFLLHIYTPRSYYNDHKHESEHNADIRYPAVINFHSGGFTIGTGTDDARFARAVIERCRAVFISVEYRLAPEYPFPTAVNDAADALLYVISHADELRIDPNRLALSGFSSGGNLAFTSLFRLTQHLRDSGSELQVSEHKVIAIASWYPGVDYTLSRAERRASAVDPSRTLSTSFTDLFDAAYLYPPDLDLQDPLVSPAQASDALLHASLPQDVMIYTCEFDMLVKEAKVFADRLAAALIAKNVHYTMIRGAEHGWDKMPIVKGTKSEEMYMDCCTRLEGIFHRQLEGYGLETTVQDNEGHAN